MNIDILDHSLSVTYLVVESFSFINTEKNISTYLSCHSFPHKNIILFAINNISSQGYIISQGGIKRFFYEIANTSLVICIKKSYLCNITKLASSSTSFLRCSSINSFISSIFISSLLESDTV